MRRRRADPAAEVSSDRPWTWARAAPVLGELASESRLTLTVRGQCMAPGLRDGERVEVVRRRLYWPGDTVVVATADGRLLVHRVVGYRPARPGPLALVTKADASPGCDRPVPLAAVVGKVGRATWGRRLASWRLFLGLAGRYLLASVRRLPRRRRAATREGDEGPGPGDPIPLVTPPPRARR